MSRRFVRENKEVIWCEPIGMYLDDLEREMSKPVSMRLIR